MPDRSSSSQSKAAESIYELERRGASPELIRDAMKARRRKATIRLRPEIRYTIRWEPDVDCVTGEGGHGLLRGLRIWWRVRRGTWRDDDVWPRFPDEDYPEGSGPAGF